MAIVRPATAQVKGRRAKPLQRPLARNILAGSDYHLRVALSSGDSGSPGGLGRDVPVSVPRSHRMAVYRQRLHLPAAASPLVYFHLLGIDRSQVESVDVVALPNERMAALQRSRSRQFHKAELTNLVRVELQGKRIRVAGTDRASAKPEKVHAKYLASPGFRTFLRASARTGACRRISACKPPAPPPKRISPASKACRVRSRTGNGERSIFASLLRSTRGRSSSSRLLSRDASCARAH